MFLNPFRKVFCGLMMGVLGVVSVAHALTWPASEPSGEVPNGKIGDWGYDLRTFMAPDAVDAPITGVGVGNVSDVGDGRYAATVSDGSGLPSGNGQLLIFDVEGAIGAAFYCDEDGDNCTTASALFTAVAGGSTATAIQSLSDPPGSPSAGDVYYDTDDNAPYIWNGTAWSLIADDLGDHTATATLNLNTQNIDGVAFDVIGASGNTVIGGTLDVAGTVQLGLDGADGRLMLYSEQGATDYTYTIQPHPALTDDVTFTLPPDVGLPNQVLQTDGVGNMTWVTQTAGADDLGDHVVDLTLDLNTQDIDGDKFDVSGATGDVTTAGALQTGVDGTDGSIVIYSEQGGTDYTYTIQPSSAATQNVVLTLPTSDGAPDQILKTDGSGILSWVDQSAGGRDVGVGTGLFMDDVQSVGYSVALNLAVSAGSSTVSTTTDHGFNEGDRIVISVPVNGKASLTGIEAEVRTIISVLSSTSFQVDSNFINTHLTNEVVSRVYDYEYSLDTGAVVTVEVDPEVDMTVGNALSKWNGAKLVDSGIFDDGTAVTIGSAGLDGVLKFYSEQGATDYTYTIQPHSAATQDVTLVLPADDGAVNQVLQTDGDGNLSWVDQTTPADNLGDHTATQTLVVDGQEIDGTNFNLSGATGNLTLNGTLSVGGGATVEGTLQSGQDGVDGLLVIYSEQGATDYSYTIQPHDAATQDVTLTLPLDDGLPNQVLKTDGNGVLSWTTNTSGADNLGNHTATQAVILNDQYLSNDGDNEGIRVDNDGNVGIQTVPGGTYELEVNGDIFTYNIYGTSDERLKKNIKPLSNALDKISQLQGVSYRWKDAQKGDTTYLGVVAQEVEDVYPQLVQTGENGYKAVSYGAVVAPLIEAVKELKAQNEALDQRVKELESQLGQ